MADRVGQQVGNYRLIQFLGEGGYAEVYRGEHLQLGIPAAIKILRIQLTRDAVEEFREEARTLAKLMHEHIVRVIDFDIIEEHTPYLVMDYAPNGTLRKRYPKGSILPPEKVVLYAQQIASALQYAHAQKLVHCDVKPDNVLLSNSNRVLLSDFGIAIVTQTRSSSNLRSGPLPGTAAYMAPEQFNGTALPASDQYALGITVYEWLCGTRPFHGNWTNLAEQHQHASPLPLQERKSSLSPALNQAVLKALAKDPKERYANVEAFAYALEQALKPIEALPTTINFAMQSTPSQRENNDLKEVQGPPFLGNVISPGDGWEQADQTILRSPANTPGAGGGWGQADQTFLRPQANVPSSPGGWGQADQTILPQANVPSSPGGWGQAGQAVSGPQGAVPSLPTAYGRADSTLASTWGTPPAPPPPSLRRGLSTRTKVVLAVLVLLVIGGTLFGYTRWFLSPSSKKASSTEKVVNATPFSDKAIATAIAQASATAGSSQTAYLQATNQAPTLYDPLTVEGGPTRWIKGPQDNGNCSFIENAFHIVELQREQYQACIVQALTLSNFACQIQLSIIAGDYGGIVFRADQQHAKFYAFGISLDGTYYFWLYTSQNPNPILLQKNSTPVIKTGLGKLNSISVLARGGDMYFFMNASYIFHVHNDESLAGDLGVFAGANTNFPADVAFTNIEVWKLQ